MAGKEFRKPLRAAVLKALQDADSRVRVEAVRTLALSDDDEAIAALATAMRQDHAARVRTRAALYLNDIRSNAVVPHLRELLLVDYRVRPDFAGQLRAIGTPQALAVLREGLKSINPRVRAECAKQLWLLNDRAAKKPLVEILRSDDAELKTDVAGFLAEASRAQADSPARLAGATDELWASWLEKQ